MLGPEVPGPAQSRAGHIDRDDPGAEGHADVYGHKPTPPQPCTASHSPGRSRAWPVSAR